MAFKMNVNGAIWDTFAGGYVKDNKIISTTPIFTNTPSPILDPTKSTMDIIDKLTSGKLKPTEVKKEPVKSATRQGQKVVFYDDGTIEKVTKGKPKETEYKEESTVLGSIGVVGDAVGDAVGNVLGVGDGGVDKYIKIFLGILGASVVVKIIK